MKMKSLTFFALVLPLCLAVQAGSLFKCEAEGKIEFQDKPCSSAMQKIACPSGDGRVVYVDELSSPCKNSEPETNRYGYGYGSFQNGSSFSSGSQSGTRSSPGNDVTVRGYIRSDGTAVQSHTRSAPGRGR